MSFIDKLIKEIGEDSKKVVSTHKMTPDQKKLWAEVKTLADKRDEAIKKSKTARAKFWNKVESDLENYEVSMQVNKETEEIEVLEIKE